MIYLLALIPATALTIAGYFVLYLSNRSEGAFQKFGKYLGFWAFTLAALVVLGAIFAAAHRYRHHGMMGERGEACPMMYGHPRDFGPRDGERRDGVPAEPPVGTAPRSASPEPATVAPPKG